jgi:hypothetical protein
VRLWQEILAKAPADASWRPMIEDGLLLMSGNTLLPENSRGGGSAKR